MIKTTASPTKEIIGDFNAGQGDSLNLPDLLQNEVSNNMTDYISVTECQ